LLLGITSQLNFMTHLLFVIIKFVATAGDCESVIGIAMKVVIWCCGGVDWLEAQATGSYIPSRCAGLP